MTGTNQDGYYAFENMPMGGAYQIVPTKNDDPLNGVSTLDLILIQRHLLGISPLHSPYQYVAADIDKSKNINGVDLIELRKLILGIYNEFPQNDSWRFIDEDFKFSNKEDPWVVPMPELYTCLLYTSPSPRDATLSRMPSSA